MCFRITAIYNVKLGTCASVAFDSYNKAESFCQLNSIFVTLYAIQTWIFIFLFCLNSHLKSNDMTVTGKILLFGAIIFCAVAVSECVCNLMLFIFIYILECFVLKL